MTIEVIGCCGAYCGTCKELQSETCKGCKIGSQTTAFVNIVTMLNDGFLANQTVLAKDGIIEALGDSTLMKIPENAFVIDGNDNYLMPALIDIHTHLGDNRDDILLYIAKYDMLNVKIKE